MTEHRKPRILIAGEFSAGKTQLINGLLGRFVLPSNVTSTSLPPMWIVSQKTAPYRVTLSGERKPMPALNNVDVQDTLYCVMHSNAPLLAQVELIDTPGNSDPNIPSECWQRMLEHADYVIWCSNAVQAWRQSEKAVWRAMDERLRKNATMIITHADRLPDAKSAEKVMRRVQRDAAPFFDHFMMASLLDETDLERIEDHIVALAEGSLQPERAAASAPSPLPAPQTAPVATDDETLANVVALFEGDTAKSDLSAPWRLWHEITAHAPPQTNAEWEASLAIFIDRLGGLDPADIVPNPRPNTASGQ